MAKVPTWTKLGSFVLMPSMSSATLFIIITVFMMLRCRNMNVKWMWSVLNFFNCTGSSARNFDLLEKFHFHAAMRKCYGLSRGCKMYSWELRQSVLLLIIQHRRAFLSSRWCWKNICCCSFPCNDNWVTARALHIFKWMWEIWAINHKQIQFWLFQPKVTKLATTKKLGQKLGRP